MKRNIILILLIVSAILISGCVQQIKDVGRPAEYQTVTIKDLISDTIKYDGQKILVKGKFTDTSNRPVLLCEPGGTGLNPEIREGYRVYRSIWRISNQDGEIGVDVIDKNGVHDSTMPNYREGQEIELRGTARATTVEDYCNRDIRYKSVYIEVNTNDIDITSKPLQQFSQNEIQFTDMNEELQLCITGFHIREESTQQEFVINSQEEYNSLLEFKSPADYCDDFELPIIDFAQNTLLGKYTEGGGCSIDFVRNIYKDDSNKKVIYMIKVVEEGLCKKLGMSMNWALIPKVPSDYTIEFEVK